MADYVSDMLAAERRGRSLALIQQPRPGDVWTIRLGHGQEGCAAMTAARWAARLGAEIAIHPPEQEDPAQVWQDLLESSRKQHQVRETEPHSEPLTRLSITQDGEEWEIDEFPDDAMAWRTTLAEAAPLVEQIGPKSLRLSAAQCRKVDEIAIREFRVPGMCLMENAAVGAAQVLLDLVARPRSVLVLAGGGNNGGDGLALARGLDTLGIRVQVALFKQPEELRGDALINYHQLEQRQTVRIHYLASRPSTIRQMLDSDELLVDALLGTGFSGNLSPVYRMIIESVNEAGKSVLGLDLPSGMDAETGKVAETAIMCQRTVTFAAVKPGLEAPGAAAYTGDCYLADIGAPRESLFPS